ncbi:hypothetical protein EV702DRAFT_1201625 [Suillus placidus]|uniref:Uncharacterized protein n=1 Tax=Suillus placidus TaxID=48579 RepID=A0A9P6ZME8_9AGAM|nr:hypothetical protein EV702DRAFT_1201625 [Suillus placidus]
MAFGVQRNGFTSMLIVNGAALVKACFNSLCKLVEGSRTVLMAQMTELKHDSLKVDGVIRRVYWKIVVFADRMINTIYPCHDEVTLISPETKRKYNRKYEAKFTPEEKEKRRKAQAACKRKLRAARKLRGASPTITSGTSGPDYPPPLASLASGCHSMLNQHLNVDHASGMQGIQVPEDPETVTWSDGHITVLPTVMREGQNVLKEDAELTKKLAEVPTSKPGSEFVAHFDFHHTSRD